MGMSNSKKHKEKSLKRENSLKKTKHKKETIEETRENDNEVFVRGIKKSYSNSTDTSTSQPFQLRSFLNISLRRRPKTPKVDIPTPRIVVPQRSPNNFADELSAKIRQSTLTRHKSIEMLAKTHKKNNEIEKEPINDYSKSVNSLVDDFENIRLRKSSSRKGSIHNYNLTNRKTISEAKNITRKISKASEFEWRKSMDELPRDKKRKSTSLTPKRKKSISVSNLSNSTCSSPLEMYFNQNDDKTVTERLEYLDEMMENVLEYKLKVDGFSHGKLVEQHINIKCDLHDIWANVDFVRDEDSTEIPEKKENVISLIEMVLKSIDVKRRYY